MCHARLLHSTARSLRPGTMRGCTGSSSGAPYWVPGLQSPPHVLMRDTGCDSTGQELTAMSGTFSRSCLYHPPLSQLSHPKPVQCKAVPMSELLASEMSKKLPLLSGHLSDIIK